MGTENPTVITLSMPSDEVHALLHLVKRLTYDDCVRLAGGQQRPHGRTEPDLMWCAVTKLERQLAEADFAPH